MLLVLDSNEYIFSFGFFRKETSRILLDTIVELIPRYSIRIPRLIAREVQRNLTPEEYTEFIHFLHTLDIEIDDDASVPFEIGAKYESQGLKSADAFIAAFTEWVGADVLITENRHFLTRRTDLPFKVLIAEQFLRSVSHHNS